MAWPRLWFSHNSPPSVSEPRSPDRDGQSMQCRDPEQSALMNPFMSPVVTTPEWKLLLSCGFIFFMIVCWLLRLGLEIKCQPTWKLYNEFKYAEHDKIVKIICLGLPQRPGERAGAKWIMWKLQHDKRQESRDIITARDTPEVVGETVFITPSRHNVFWSLLLQNLNMISFISSHSPLSQWPSGAHHWSRLVTCQ